MITYIDPHITVEQLCQEMRDICRFPQDQVFTMKWVDEEGEFHISVSLLTFLLPLSTFQILQALHSMICELP